MLITVLIAFVLWALLLIQPWQSWRCRERLEVDTDNASPPLDDITVLIPARNESTVLESTLSALKDQDSALGTVLVDDNSTDDTANIARQSGLKRLRIIKASEPPSGWSGKLWALEQGLGHIESEWLLLLDADIRLGNGILAAMGAKAKAEALDMCSILAAPCFAGFWAKLLLPAFVYFFKLLYPFALSNKPGARIAAAAGGCILIRTAALREAGGFSAWHDKLIDDCALARAMKEHGFKTWLGLSKSVTSQRRQGLLSIIHMVARTAYVQLSESLVLLASASILMLLAFVAPLVALDFAGLPRWIGGFTLLLATLSYLPVIRYYRLCPIRAVTLPIAGGLYLLMSWYSAARYLFGTRSAWKGRNYRRETT